MPSSALSRPRSSTSSLTRMPTVTLRPSQSAVLMVLTKAPTATMPMIWAIRSPPPKIPTASVPQTPATKCTEIAPTTSSIRNLSSSGTNSTTSAPPMPPMTIASRWFCRSGPAVIATRPARAPLSAKVRSTFLNSTWAVSMAATTPAAAARLVLTNTMAMAAASSALPSASCEPPLNPNQPSHRMKVPRVASGRLAPGMGLTRPSGPYLPFRAPRMIAPVSAAQPPTEWTTVEPAKSEKPNSARKPPPQLQAPWIG